MKLRCTDSQTDGHTVIADTIGAFSKHLKLSLLCKQLQHIWIRDVILKRTKILYSFITFYNEKLLLLWLEFPQTRNNKSYRSAVYTLTVNNASKHCCTTRKKNNPYYFSSMVSTLNIKFFHLEQVYRRIHIEREFYNFQYILFVCCCAAALMQTNKRHCDKCDPMWCKTKIYFC